MATTINNYSVGLSLNASDYIRQSSLSRSETARLKREIEGARTPAEAYNNRLLLLNRALKEGAIEQSTYNRMLDSAKQKFTAVGDAVKSSANSINNLNVSLKTAAAAYVGAHAGGFAKNFLLDSVKLAAETESASIAFEVLTGSAGQASMMLSELRRLAATSPLTFGDTQAAARTMLSFNIAANEIIPTLKRLGDVTGGTSERFKMMTLAYSQMSAAGRMMGQDLLQMINAGFNPLQEISRKTGESMLQLKKRMEDGAISALEVSEAFKTATSQGGMFFGMIDKQAQTTEGRLTRLKDQVDQLKRKLGEELTPGANVFLNQLTAWTRQFQVGMEILDPINNFGVGWGALRALDKDAKNALINLSSLEQRFREGRLFDNLNKFRNQTFNPRLMSNVDRNYKPDWFVEQKPQDFALSHKLEDLINESITSVQSLGSTVMSGLSTFQSAADSIAHVGMANTQELIKATKENPAVKSLQVGTQEAYQQLTQSARDAEKQSRLDAERQKQLAENAKAQREKMTQWLEKINESLEQNGFKRIR